jgi:CBS domain-containing protein
MSSIKILVRDYMKPVSLSFTIDTSVEEVVKALVKHKAVGGPVLDGDKKLVGFVTEKDLLKQMLNDSYYCEDHQVVSEIMRKNPLSVSPDENIMELAERMTNRMPKMYPVLEGEKLVGIITRSDVLKALSLARVNSCGTK